MYMTCNTLINKSFFSLYKKEKRSFIYFYKERNIGNKII